MLSQKKNAGPQDRGTAAGQLWDDLLAKALDDHNPKDNVTRPVAKKRIGGALLMHAVYQIHVVRTAAPICHCLTTSWFPVR